MDKTVFMGIHGNLALEGCIELTKLANSKNLQNRHGVEVDPQVVKRFMELSGAEEGTCFFNPHAVIHSLFVYIEGVVIDIPSFEPEFITMFQMPERIETVTSMMKKYKEEQNYVGMFGLIDKRFRISEFIRLYMDIPLTQKYDVFEFVYTSSESGFELFPIKVLQNIKGCAHVSETYRETRDELYEKYDADELINVYRGQGNVAREKGDEEVQSWSLNKETAEMFATRFNQQGTIESKQVYRHDIQFYFTSRNEAEVLLF